MGDRRAFNAMSRLVALMRQPRPDPGEEQDLLRRASAGDKRAVQRLVGGHLPVVVGIARGYRGWGLPMSDLIQEGILGLMRAVRRYDPAKGVRLATYARWWIKMSIQDAVLRSWSMVRLGSGNAQRMMALSLKSPSAQQSPDAADATNDDPLAALARRFGAPRTEAQRLAERMRGRDGSLDTAVDGGPPAVERLICDAPTPEQAAARRDERRLAIGHLRPALAALSPRERFVLHKRYFEDARHTFAAIGRELGVSKDRARQLEARALAKLRSMLPASLANLGG